MKQCRDEVVEDLEKEVDGLQRNLHQALEQRDTANRKLAEMENAAREVAKQAETYLQERDKLAAEARGSARATALNFAINYYAGANTNDTRVVDTANRFLLFLRGEPTVSPPTGAAPSEVDPSPVMPSVN